MLVLRRRADRPSNAKPPNIIIQVDGSGMSGMTMMIRATGENTGAIRMGRGITTTRHSNMTSITTAIRDANIVMRGAVRLAPPEQFLVLRSVGCLVVRLAAVAITTGQAQPV